MSNARNIARLLPNTSGLIPDTNIAAISGSKISGTLPQSIMPSGTVLQTVTATNFTDIGITATSETVYINPLITITPKKSNSLIVFSMVFNAYHGSNDFYTSIWIRRNTAGTAISSHASQPAGWGDWTTNFGSMLSVGAHAQKNLATAWDYPGTPSTVNYILTGMNHSASKTFQLWSSSGGVRITAVEYQQ